MTLTHNKRAIGIFSGYHEAENALSKLQCAGFAMNQVSIIAKEGDADLSATTYFGEEAKTGAEAGAVVGGLTGFLVSMGIVAISGVAPIVLAGTTATAIATTLAGSAIGTVAGGFVGGLVELGIPEQQARNYHNQVINGKYLILVDGTEAEILGAGTILRRRGIRDWGVYSLLETRKDIDPNCMLMKL